MTGLDLEFGFMVLGSLFCSQDTGCVADRMKALSHPRPGKTSSRCTGIRVHIHILVQNIH